MQFFIHPKKIEIFKQQTIILTLFRKSLKNINEYFKWSILKSVNANLKYTSCLAATQVFHLVKIFVPTSQSQD